MDISKIYTVDALTLCQVDVVWLSRKVYPVVLSLGRNQNSIRLKTDLTQKLRIVFKTFWVLSVLVLFPSEKKTLVRYETPVSCDMYTETLVRHLPLLAKLFLSHSFDFNTVFNFGNFAVAKKKRKESFVKEMAS